MDIFWNYAIRKKKFLQRLHGARKIVYVIDAYLACEQREKARASGEGARGRQSRLLSRASRACTFHDIPQMESLLAG